MTQTTLFDQKLLGPSLFIPKALLKHVNKSTAALLQQLHYSLKTSQFTQYGQTWVCRTQEDWAKILDCSVSTIFRAFTCLESLGVVISRRLHKHTYNQLKSYRVDYDVLAQLLGQSTCQDLVRQPEENDHVILTSSISKNLKTRNLNKQQTVEVEPEDELPSPPNHPVQIPEVNKRESLTPTDTQINPENQEKDINPELEQEIVQTVGHKISANLKQLIAQTKLEIVLDALKVVKHNIQKQTCKNPAGLLTTAIRREWKPSAASLSSENNVTLDPDFSEWFDAAKALGLVMGSELKGGQLWIYATPEGKPQPYEEMRSMFSMSWLKKRL
jgi:hypothetical protein